MSAFPPPPQGRARVGVVIPAAGSGQRMGGLKKPWLLLGGEPVLLHALRPFVARSDVIRVAVVLSPPDLEDPPGWVEDLDPRIELVPGGDTRTASVHAGLQALPPDLDVIVVHDAARPLLERDLLTRCIDLARAGKGAVAGHPVVDTVKVVDGEGHVVSTPDRDRLWQAQTPQAFPAPLLRNAYTLPDRSGATDDSTLVERAGGTVLMVRASPRNLKVTTPDDLLLAERFLVSAESARVS